MKCVVAATLLCLTLFASAWATEPPPVVHSAVGQTMRTPGGKVTLTCVGKKQHYAGGDTLSRDTDVVSPKSVNFHPDGTRFYINSLEGCKTVVYDARTGAKRAVINHRFSKGYGPLWNPPSGYYRFTHYPGGDSLPFQGKPVESTFSHGGRYLWVPYYRRTFDINAQDPSAIAVIDTRADTICRMLPTGPLPKMVTVSHDGKLVAVTHWGDNTVGLVDVSDADPRRWHHLPPVVVDHKLSLNFSLETSVDRDEASGLRLRGTAFTPDDRYLLVGCMGGEGIAVIDVAQKLCIGKIDGIFNVRHMLIDGKYLYASINVAGLVCRVPLDNLFNAIEHRNGTHINVAGWQQCQVGMGARTIELSPDGNWIFAACNDASALYVIDARSMTVAGHLAVDSYPVGLGLSPDGCLLVTTSQGKQGQGGNAVNMFRVDYATMAAGDTEHSTQHSFWAKNKIWGYYMAALAVILLGVLLL